MSRKHREGLTGRGWLAIGAIVVFVVAVFYSKFH